MDCWRGEGDVMVEGVFFELLNYVYTSSKGLLIKLLSYLLIQWYMTSWREYHASRVAPAGAGSHCTLGHI